MVRPVPLCPSFSLNPSGSNGSPVEPPSPSREQHKTRPGRAPGLHRSDCTREAESASPTCFLSPWGWPQPIPHREHGGARTSGGPAHNAAPGTDSPPPPRRCSAAASPWAPWGSPWGRAGPRRALCQARAAAATAPPPRRRKLRADPAPREATARPRRSGRRPPRPARNAGGAKGRSKLGSDWALVFFLRNYLLRLLCFLNNLFFE